MDARSIAGCLLLSLAALFSVEAVLDAVALHGARRPQWRTSDHASGPRAVLKSPLAGVPDAPSATAANRRGLLLSRDHPTPAPPHPAPIFVPPRV